MDAKEGWSLCRQYASWVHTWLISKAAWVSVGVARYLLVNEFEITLNIKSHHFCKPNFVPILGGISMLKMLWGTLVLCPPECCPVTSLVYSYRTAALVELYDAALLMSFTGYASTPTWESVSSLYQFYFPLGLQ